MPVTAGEAPLIILAHREQILPVRLEQRTAKVPFDLVDLGKRAIDWYAKLPAKGEK
ncbi:MAG: hypothetical protein HUU20_16130 [Pirellulales bacterium]|nr:hypothetical protein [Pirellulales bacterium]